MAVPQGGTRDVTLSCDVTASVGDTARTLIRAGAGDEPRLQETAASRRAPVTLRGRSAEGGPTYLLDPAVPLGASGLRSGWIVTPVLEFGARGHEERMISVAGYIEVRSGAHAGVIYSLIPGHNSIGRDRSNRIHLSDASVSRRHAMIDIVADNNSAHNGAVKILDLGSANGLSVDGRQVSEAQLTGPAILRLGDVELAYRPGPPPSPVPHLTHQIMHMRAPRVDPRFPATERELPAPPAPAKPSRIPMLAMLAPMLMGGAMFAITRSPMSLMMVAFSPMMMIGSWIDNTIGGKRKLRKETETFQETIDAERSELIELRQQEIAVRSAETPTLTEVAAAIAERGSLLWTRRPEHRSFLEIRFGNGALPSRTEVKLPSRGESAKEQWDRLRRIEQEFSEAEPVPVLERFDRCGSIGVAGDLHWAEGAARSLIMQLVGLHSPAELSLACFAGPAHAASWSWLKWLPHVDAVNSPIPSWQLAEDPAGSTRLIMALEGLLETRKAQIGAGATLRSHLETDTRNDAEHGEAVNRLPVIPAVLVLVLDDGQVDKSRLIALAESGPDAGIHLLWVTRTPAELPAACRTFLEVSQAQGRVSFVRSGTVVNLSYLEYLEQAVATDLARRLSSVADASDRILDESDLPKAVNLRDLSPVDILGGPAPILQSWASTGSLTAQWQRGTERQELKLAAVVGQGPTDPAVIDIRAHGPHALVGGTTGAGKSEFLQTWIMSLASQLSPDRLTFLLVDYKGGAAFAECVDLPHTVGLVTDLSPHLVRRALTSLRAELHYREELLAQHGAKDLITMERRSDPAAPPVLLIVIDEFAALAGEVPEFVDGVIDVAQRGRSLGLHLIMATQRPAGVIKDNLRANTNLRVALRMADESDSSDVIGVKDAAFFDAETPGRGAIKVGPGKMGHFQTGYLGGRLGTESRDPEVEIASLEFSESAPWNIPPEPQRSGVSSMKPLRDIERLRDGIVAAAQQARLAQPRRPWLDALPAVLDLAELETTPVSGEASSDAVVFGLRDEPASQSQRVTILDLEDSGNVAFIGAGGTGKTSALITVAASLSSGAVKHPVEIYGIDGGGGALDVLAALPTAGAIAPLSDIELTTRVLQHLLDLIAERGPRFAAARAGSLSHYRRSGGSATAPRVVLMLDGFGAFRQATEGFGGHSSPFQMLSDIMMTGRSVGVHVVLTSDRAAGIPSSMTSSLQKQYVLRLANVHDYGHLGVKGDALEEAPPGRALLAGDADEIQIAILGGNPELSEQAKALEALAARLQHEGVTPATEIRNAPEVVPLSELPVSAGGAPVFGINTQTFAPLTLPTSGLGVVSGPPGSGQSTAVLACAEAVARWVSGQGEDCERVLLTFNAEGLRSRGVWDRTATGEDEVRTLAEQLVVALGGKPVAKSGGLTGGLIGGGLIGGSALPVGAPAGESDPEPLEFPSPGARGVIVVERPSDAEGTAALPTLVALAKTARKADVLVLFEFEQGTGSGVWDLFTALKQPAWGLSLQPDDGESQTPFREYLGRVKRADFPPGRGFMVQSGKATPAHVAMPSGGFSPIPEDAYMRDREPLARLG
ncbi:FtsK/SpoIIIE domain-containing protein [Leucobacter insecticola]|uniref:FtsK/SpoIIIE domain-containing protein n=1 Tax=Leucobacter insecticola TaxID=2714934 RepID=UPI001FCC3857|nr:FtsK/SpoIIIE domain-containing protein [Leucobacter insecticola]